MEQADNRVGVFMQLFRNETTMHKAIQSVINQTYENIRFYILVSDQTETVVRDCYKDPRIVVWKKESKFDYNYYIKKAASDNNAYITVIDADDWYDEYYIEQLLKYSIANKTDITACGFFFVNEQERIIEERKAIGMAWDRNHTDKVFPYMYAFFRPIWGKLYSVDVILQFDIQNLISNECCGGYGTDTTFVFNLLREAERIGVLNESLYYYRLSQTGESYNWKEGRENSDEFLFQYVQKVMEEISSFGEYERRFLFHVYGSALLDTLNLIRKIDVDDAERIKKIKYMLERPLTIELFQREKKGAIEIDVVKSYRSFQKQLFDMILKMALNLNDTSRLEGEYLQLFESMFPNKKGVLNLEEFQLLLHGNGLLELFCYDRFDQLFDSLLSELRTAYSSKEKDCLAFMRRLTNDTMVKSLLTDGAFVSEYEDIIRLVKNQKKNEALQAVKNYFSDNQNVYEPKRLIELWINLAATLENVNDFLVGKKIEVDILIALNELDEAREKYNELVELGVSDDYMTYLGGCLNI